MKTIAIVPARMNSKRFPGKPLAMIDGTPMVECVRRAACEAGLPTMVACDDTRIAHAVGSENAVIVTDPCPNGSMRCLLAARKAGLQLSPTDIIVNIQGDEPFIDPPLIARLAAHHAGAASRADVSTAIYPITNAEELRKPETVKVVTDCRHRALLFSRAVIPAVRDSGSDLAVPYFGHIGIYAYTVATLERIHQAYADLLLPSPAERAESLEQLGWLHLGMNIECITTGNHRHGIDRPLDLPHEQP